LIKEKALEKIFTVFFLTAIVCCFTQARAEIGIISSHENNPAQITRSDKKIAGVKGVTVEMADIVETTDGKANIKFKDDTVVEVNDHSKLEIDEFVYDSKTPAASKLSMNFAAGTLRYASGAIAHNNPSQVDIHTPSATIAVRGTDFAATTDETGASTIILLPSCPTHWQDINNDCKTGIIDVYNSEGSVTLTKPFEGTKIQNSSISPSKPVTLNLSFGAINNLLIVSPPAGLNNSTAKSGKSKNDLNMNFLEDSADLLDNIFVAIKENTDNSLQTSSYSTNNNEDAAILRVFPEYKKSSGVQPKIDSTEEQLCRQDGVHNTQCIGIPAGQNTAITQTQKNITVINRAYSGGNSTIILKQN
jgi:hypothetical protein